MYFPMEEKSAALAMYRHATATRKSESRRCPNPIDLITSLRLAPLLTLAISRLDVLAWMSVLDIPPVRSQRIFCHMSESRLEKRQVKYVGSTRNSISLEWDGREDAELAYTVQIEDPAYHWITKYWGRKTRAVIEGLGPEELYTIRLGVSKYLGEDKWSQEVWSDVIISATQFDLPWTFYLFQHVHQNATADVVAFSKKRRSCLDVYNKYGDTPLILAIKEQKGDVVEALVDSGADPSQPARPLRKTPLMVACFGGYKAAADSLVKRGVDWNMVDSNKCQALHYAVDGCQLEMVRYGIERGADVNAQDKFGWTPLMRGVLIGCQLSIISLLLENGADVNLRDANKMRALDLARLVGSQELIGLLEKHTPQEDLPVKENNLESEQDYIDLEDEMNIEAKKEEEEEKEAEELMRRIDHILGLPVEDDKLQEVDNQPKIDTENIFP